MSIKQKLDKLNFRGLDFKYWIENIALCLITIVLSSLMVIVNKMELPGEIYRLETRWDQAIPLILPFVWAYLLYFPFLYLGWASIFVF